jgi:hypothetical protein
MQSRRSRDVAAIDFQRVCIRGRRCAGRGRCRYYRDAPVSPTECSEYFFEFHWHFWRALFMALLVFSLGFFFQYRRDLRVSHKR